MLELYGTASCPYTAQLREDLEFRGRDFIEYDVETDETARLRLRTLAGGGAVPVLIDKGAVVQVGYEGRSCYIDVRAGGAM
jgi:mycoredoxin